MAARKQAAKHDTTTTFRPANDEQRDFVRSMCENPLTICRSRSYGNGKSYCAIGYASGLLTSKDVERVIFVRDTSIVSDRMGYMPGSASEKLANSVKFAKTYFKKFLGASLKTDMVEYRDVADIAGETFDDAFMIFDEASDSSLYDLQMFISRAGKNARCCILGTDKQIQRGDSGFPQLWQKLDGCPHVGRVELRQVLRNDWVGQVLARLDGAA